MSFDIVTIIKATGYLGLFGIVFAESGLLIGLFLPGDSLLFTAGFLASQGILNLPITITVIFVAAVAGVSTGYEIGRRFGPRIFKRDKSLLFNKEYIQRSQQFYQRHGGKTIMLARFVPIVRTIAPLLAGVGDMNYLVFVAYNLVGGLIWSIALPLLGYFLGRSIPNIDHYLLPIVLIIIVVSLLPSLLHVLKSRKGH